MFVAGSSTKLKLESYKAGYPRLAAFLNLDRNFGVWKRFDYLHVRNLLELQDELNELEAELRAIDAAETTRLYLSSRRQDGNFNRRHVLSLIRRKLEEYDKHVLHYHQLMCLPEAQAAHRQSLAHWVDGNKPLVRAESACFLESLGDDDFVALNPPDPDRAMPEIALDWAVRTFPKLASIISYTRDRTDDDNIFLFRHRTLRWIIKCLIALIMPLWLALHAAVMFNLSNNASRAVAYSVFTLATSFLITFGANSTKYNLILALLTYAAVPAVFLSEDSGVNRATNGPG